MVRRVSYYSLCLCSLIVLKYDWCVCFSQYAYAWGLWLRRLTTRCTPTWTLILRVEVLRARMSRCWSPVHGRPFVLCVLLIWHPLYSSLFERSRRRSRTSRSPSPPPRNTASPTSLGGNALTLGYKTGRDEGGCHKSPEGQEVFSVKTAVEESYRPQESEVYGAHVPLVERAARLQCVAMLSLVAGGEDDTVSGGGSGTGGEGV